MPIEQQLQEIQSQISSAQQKKSRAQVERENALKEVAEQRRVLAEEYGVTTNDQIKATLLQLQTDLDAELAAARTALASTFDE